MRCDEFREMLEPYLADTLDAPHREAFRDHLGSCADCRGWAVREEPTLLFIGAAPVEADAARVEGCTRAVLTEIRQDRLRKRLGVRRRRWLAAAAAMLVVIAGGTTWRLGLWTDETAPAVIGEISETEAVSPPPRVEVNMAGDGVRVYQFADEDNGDTAVYFIVNPALEL